MKKELKTEGTISENSISAIEKQTLEIIDNFKYDVNVHRQHDNVSDDKDNEPESVFKTFFIRKEKGSKTR